MDGGGVEHLIRGNHHQNRDSNLPPAVAYLTRGQARPDDDEDDAERRYVVHERIVTSLKEDRGGVTIGYFTTY